MSRTYEIVATREFRVPDEVPAGHVEDYVWNYAVDHLNAIPWSRDDIRDVEAADE